MFQQADPVPFTGQLPLANAITDYGEELWDECSRWFATMGPNEYLVLAGMSVVLGFAILCSTGVRR